MLPSNYSAASVTALIADISAANTAGGVVEYVIENKDRQPQFPKLAESRLRPSAEQPVAPSRKR